MREKIKKYYLEEESGQMLLFVMVILLLLLIIVLAIIVNVKVDLKETQMEREYERGYSIAEEELFDISSEGYDLSNYDTLSSEEMNKFCPSDECVGGTWECGKKSGMGEEGESAVIVKRCVHHAIRDMTIEQDQTLEAYVNGASGELNLTWQGAPAMSVMLVCKDGSGDYENVRASICLSGSGNCGGGINTNGFTTETIAKDELNVDHDAPLNMDDGCPVSYEPELLRLRAIGGEATAVTLTGDLPQQMEEIRVQSFTEGIELAEGLSAPEVVTMTMIRKRLPSIFDYVLFVANGDVSK